MIRPRYYSSELGIREKLFIGVMTSQEHINTYATAFNRTIAHLVNKIKFFIYADSVKTNYKLKNIVGFTDTHENRRPFHVIKYIADNYLKEYDYFLLVPDNVYVDARKLKKLLYHMSITFDLYMGGARVGLDAGNPSTTTHRAAGERPVPGRRTCRRVSTTETIAPWRRASSSATASSGRCETIWSGAFGSVAPPITPST